MTAGPKSVAELMVNTAELDIGRTDGGIYGAGIVRRNWCALAVCAWMEAVGLRVPLHDERSRRGARALGRWLGATNGYRLAPGQTPVDNLCAGDVIVWKRGRWQDPSEWRGHVALVTSVEDGGAIETIGGNESPGGRGWELAPGRTVRGAAVRRRRIPYPDWTRRIYCVARSLP